MLFIILNVSSQKLYILDGCLGFDILFYGIYILHKFLHMSIRIRNYPFWTNHLMIIILKGFENNCHVELLQLLASEPNWTIYNPFLEPVVDILFCSKIL